VLASDAIAIAAGKAPAPGKPAPQAPTQDPVTAGFESRTAALASAVAIMAKPSRNNRGGNAQVRAMQASVMQPAMNDAQAAAVGTAVAVSDLQPLMPQVGIITRPWPRSVLPHYADAGMSVGFGDSDSARNSAPYNPFQVRTIGNLPAKLIAPPDGQAGQPPTSDGNETGPGAAGNGSPPQP